MRYHSRPHPEADVTTCFFLLTKTNEYGYYPRIPPTKTVAVDVVAADVGDSNSKSDDPAGRDSSVHWMWCTDFHSY
jgi:hypothetical protein